MEVSEPTELADPVFMFQICHIYLTSRPHLAHISPAPRLPSTSPASPRHLAYSSPLTAFSIAA